MNTDDGHTLLVWEWMTDKFKVADKAQRVPGWSFGPEKRVKEISFYEVRTRCKSKLQLVEP